MDIFKLAMTTEDGYKLEATGETEPYSVLCQHCVTIANNLQRSLEMNVGEKVDVTDWRVEEIITPGYNSISLLKKMDELRMGKIGPNIQLLDLIIKYGYAIMDDNGIFHVTNWGPRVGEGLCR